MPNYILRDLPQDVWDKFKARSQREGWPLRGLFVQLMTDYADGRITPTSAPPFRSPWPTPIPTVLCGNRHVVPEEYLKAAVTKIDDCDLHVVSCPNCGVDVFLDNPTRDALSQWTLTRGK